MVYFDRQLCATFLVEDPDIETMKRELKDAFRLVYTAQLIKAHFSISIIVGCNI
jgi:hypothetical protein